MAKPTAPWTDEELELLQKMVTAPASRVSRTIESLKAKGVSGFTVSRSDSAIRHKRLAMIQAGKLELPEEETFKSRLEQIQKIQERHYSGISRGEKNYRQKGQKTKILCLSDIHFPFARLDLLESAIKDHRDAQVLVLNGDIVEGYAFSSYEKSRLVYATEEYRCLFNFVKAALEIFPEIHLVEGNHEDRLARYLQKNGVGQAQSCLLGPSIMRRVANGEELDTNGNTVALHSEFKSRVRFRNRESWWTQVGKTLFIHPSSKVSAIPGMTVNNWDRVFNQRFPSGTYDSIVCGHTHAVYKGVVNSRLLIEEGCLSGFMDYEWNRREPGLMKAMNGYAVIYQDEEGNTDFNASNVVYCGYVAPPDVLEVDDE